MVTNTPFLQIHPKKETAMNLLVRLNWKTSSRIFTRSLSDNSSRDKAPKSDSPHQSPEDADSPTFSSAFRAFRAESDQNTHVGSVDAAIRSSPLLNKDQDHNMVQNEEIGLASRLKETVKSVVGEAMGGSPLSEQGYVQKFTPPRLEIAQSRDQFGLKSYTHPMEYLLCRMAVKRGLEARKISDNATHANEAPPEIKKDTS